MHQYRAISLEHHICPSYCWIGWRRPSVCPCPPASSEPPCKIHCGRYWSAPCQTQKKQLVKSKIMQASEIKSLVSNCTLLVILFPIHWPRDHFHTSGSTITSLFCFAGCLMSQQHASVSQGWIYSDNCMCCHTEIEVADQTFHLTRSQYTDTGPTSPSSDPITPGAWQGSHWSANF